VNEDIGDAYVESIRLYKKPDTLKVGDKVFTYFFNNRQNVVRTVTALGGHKGYGCGRWVSMDAGEKCPSCSIRLGAATIERVDASWAIPIEAKEEDIVDYGEDHSTGYNYGTDTTEEDTMCENECNTTKSFSTSHLDEVSRLKDELNRTKQALSNAEEVADEYEEELADAREKIQKQNSKIRGLRQAMHGLQRNVKFHAKMTDYLVASLIDKAKTSL
jgi:hypothetical protein